MWNITSNDVQQAKDRVQLRRAEVERRHAEEKQALDAEFAVIETLERAASAFAVNRGHEDAAPASKRLAEIEPPEAVEAVDAGDAREGAATADEPAAELDPPGGETGSGETGSGLDILKPGSRWRLYRGSRPTEPEDTAGSTFPHAG